MDSHKLKIWIEENGTSAAKVAERAEITESYLSEILSRKKVPSLKVAKRLSKVTRGAVPIDAFVSEAA